MSFSASSGNSAELTTTKNLKRSKNKGRKKKPKTKQLQNRQNDTKETVLVQETKSQEIKPINHKSATPTTQEEQTTLATETNNLADVSTNAENKINRICESIPEKPSAGRTLVLFIPIFFFCRFWKRCLYNKFQSIYFCSLFHFLNFAMVIDGDTLQKVSISKINNYSFFFFCIAQHNCKTPDFQLNGQFTGYSKRDKANSWA